MALDLFNLGTIIDIFLARHFFVPFAIGVAWRYRVLLFDWRDTRIRCSGLLYRVSRLDCRDYLSNGRQQIGFCLTIPSSRIRFTARLISGLDTICFPKLFSLLS